MWQSRLRADLLGVPTRFVRRCHVELRTKDDDPSLILENQYCDKAAPVITPASHDLGGITGFRRRFLLR